MNNRDNRDTEVRGREHEAHHTREHGRDKMDTSWILPALIGLLLLGTLGYFLLRRTGVTERVATTAETIDTKAREVAEEAKAAVESKPAEEVKPVTPDEKPKA